VKHFSGSFNLFDASFGVFGMRNKNRLAFSVVIVTHFRVGEKHMSKGMPKGIPANLS